MSHVSELISTDIQSYLHQHEHKELLRLLTCGSVDDGKSTLIGRLLHDSKMIYEDQLAAVQNDTKRHGTTGDKVDLALLVDGLQAEREQGITIDVAYRYFSTTKRKFIIADTPGHEQYTRNMATGASTCDLAVILVDARYGVLTQTRRHTYIASLLGIKHIVVAINKMDLVGFEEKTFEQIKLDYLNFAENLQLPDVSFIPLSALEGDNVVNKSEHMPWYTGPALLSFLESVEIAGDKNISDLRFPVQYINRPNLNFRGYCGTITSGTVSKGEPVKVLPSGQVSRIKDIVSYKSSLDLAFVGQAVTLTLEDEIDISRGDVLVHPDSNVKVSNHLRAHLIWMSESQLDINREYLFKFTNQLVPGQVTDLEYQVDVNTQQHHSSASLDLNGIGVVDVQLNRLVVTDTYQQGCGTGAFIVIDRLSNLTVAAGMVIELKDNKDTVHHSKNPPADELNLLLQQALPKAEFEQELNKLIRKHFPQWQAKEIGHE